MADDSGTPRLYPVFLDLGGRLCVVVGGGADAVRRVRAWMKCGADVAVIAANPDQRLIDMSAEGVLTLETRDYIRGDLAGAFVVACLVSDDETHRAIAEEANQIGCLLSVPDSPELSNFLVPSTVTRGPLQLAISTSGTSPALAKRVKTKLAEEYDESWTEYVTLLGEMRRIVVARVDSAEKRRAMLEAMVDSNLLERVRAGDRLNTDLLYLEFFQAS